MSKQILKSAYEQLHKLQLEIFILRTNYKKTKEENKRMKQLLKTALKDINFLLYDNGWCCKVCKYFNTNSKACDSCKESQWKHYDEVMEILKSE